MNKMAEKIATLLSSTPVVLGFTTWTVAHAIISQDYVSTISDVAIAIGLLILRAESVQAARTEKNVKADVELSETILEEIREQEFKR